MWALEFWRNQCDTNPVCLVSRYREVTGGSPGPKYHPTYRVFSWGETMECKTLADCMDDWIDKHRHHMRERLDYDRIVERSIESPLERLMWHFLRKLSLYDDMKVLPQVPCGRTR